jgi:hypothetical protein
MTSGGRVLSTFRCRCNIDEVPDEWIMEQDLENKLEHFPLVEGQRELMASFLHWLDPSRPMFVDCGFPVDVGFLRLFGIDDRWQKRSPYPLYDISSIIMSAGEDPLVDRNEYAKDLIGEKKGNAHDPSWDAEVSGLCAIRALRKLQALHRKR